VFEAFCATARTAIGKPIAIAVLTTAMVNVRFVLKPLMLKSQRLSHEAKAIPSMKV